MFHFLFCYILERKDKKWFKRDIIVLISFLILFVSISFLVNIGKEVSLPGFRIILTYTFTVFIMHQLQNSPYNRGVMTLYDIRSRRTLVRMLSGDDVRSALRRGFPAGIWCQNDVALTSMRRDDVASTLIRRQFLTKCPLGWLMVALTVITTVFDWLNDVTDIRHNALSSNKTASVFYLFHCLFAIKSANNA